MEIGDPGGYVEWLTESLDRVSEIGRTYHREPEESDSELGILQALSPSIAHLLNPKSFTFLTVPVGSVEFRPAFCDPSDASESLEIQIERQVASGTFSWALYQNTPVVVAGAAPNEWVLLHALATPTRVLGMFVAVLDQPSSFVPDVAKKMLSLLFGNASGALYAITHRKTQRQVVQRLEAKIDARTVALCRAEEAARVATEAKASFLANMSHDIRSPMNGILGMSSLLVGTGLTSDQAVQVEAIQRSGKTLLRLIDEILDVSRAESGRLTLHTADLDLRHLVEAVVEDHWHKAKKKGLELFVRYGSRTPNWVRGDAVRIEQILRNLVSNAVKFTLHGHVFIEVEQTARGDFKLTVSDTGRGIPPDRLDAVFDSFVRLDSSLARPAGGTGMGLPAARELAQLMGGTLVAQNSRIGGSEFSVTLPLCSAPPPHGPLSDWGRLLTGERVFVVGHHYLLRGIVSELITDLGGKPDVYLPSDAPREPEGNGTADVLVMLDDGTGQALTNNEAGSWRWSVYIGPDQTAAQAAGFDAFVTGPVTFQGLADALREGRRTEPIVLRSSGTEGAKVQHHGRGRVLLVDDDEVSCLVGKLMLKRLGCEVEVVQSGEKALSLLTGKTRFDLVLMDCQMPDMDGLEVTRTLRAWERTREGRTPVAALTAGVENSVRDACLRAGMDDLITKPVRLDALESVLDRWIPIRDGAGTKFEDVSCPSLGVCVFDEALAMRHMGGDPALFVEVLAVLEEAWPDVRRRIREGLVAQSLEAVSRAAHRLRGAASNLGAIALWNAAGQLEEAGRSQDDVVAGRLFLVVEEEFDRFVAVARETMMEDVV